MAEIIRTEGDWTYITLRVPRRAWEAYEDEFPEWALAVCAVRDQVYYELLAAPHRRVSKPRGA